MKHIWFLGTIGVVSGALFGGYLICARSVEADPLDDALLQSPTVAAIRRDLAAHAMGSAPLTETQRQDLFADEFTHRFRIHEPKMAIRARFEEINHVRNRIKLMCPARMEPWNMDRVALTVWREAKECLGQAYDVDLYETFIGSPPLKVGELRSLRSDARVACISYAPLAPHVSRPRAGSGEKPLPTVAAPALHADTHLALHRDTTHP